jgi:hypothetical protein
MALFLRLRQCNDRLRYATGKRTNGVMWLQGRVTGEIRNPRKPGADMSTGLMSEIKRIRLEMGYSLREMAADVGEKGKPIPPATYQRWDEGTAQTPDHIIAKARRNQEADRLFMAGIPDSVDANLVNGRCPNEAIQGAF